MFGGEFKRPGEIIALADACVAMDRLVFSAEPNCNRAECFTSFYQQDAIENENEKEGKF